MPTLNELAVGAGAAYLFHYTDAASARGIIEEGYLTSGAGAAYGVGIYATDIPPRDAATLDEVITNCFYGDALPLEVAHAVVVRPKAGRRAFAQTSDPYQWVLPTQKLELVYVGDFYVAAALWNGDAWFVYDE